MSTICFISIPRTGSNHLCASINNFSEVHSTREIFNPAGSFGLSKKDIEYINSKFSKRFKSLKDKELITFFRDNPIDVIEALEESALTQGKHVFSFKLFPNQLKDEDVIKLLNKKNIQFVFILRRCIDSYISLRKAQAKQVWHSESTTGELIDVTYTDFERWYSEMSKWYTSCEEQLISNSRNFSYILYEKDIDCSQLDLLNSFRLYTRPLGISLNRVDKAQRKGLQKQDKANKIAEKISNWDSFKAELHENNRFFDALNYFL